MHLEGKGRLVCCAACFLLAAFFLTEAVPAQSGGRRVPSRDRLITREEANQLYEELSEKHGWTRQEMGQALETSLRIRELFQIYVRLYNQGIPPRAIERSFKVCDGYESVINQYWEMINKYHFHPREVDAVFSELPGEIMRFYYFQYRTGGNLGIRAEKGGDIPPGRPGNRYSEREVLTIFRRTGSDMATIQPYFEHRQKGLSPQEAWEKVEQLVKERAEEEKERTERQEEEREEEKIRRRQEAEEGRRRARELLGIDEDDEPESEEPEEERERMRGYSLDELLGRTEEKETQEEAEPEGEKEGEEEGVSDKGKEAEGDGGEHDDDGDEPENDG